MTKEVIAWLKKFELNYNQIIKILLIIEDLENQDPLQVYEDLTEYETRVLIATINHIVFIEQNKN